MEKKLVIAIYSGSIPSSVFIENMIKLVSDKNHKILLFGKGESIQYKNNNIIVHKTPKGFFQKSIFIVFQILLMSLTRPRRFIKLAINYKKLPKSDSTFNMLSKILPVINNLPDIFHIQWAKSLPYWYFLKEVFQIKIILSLRGSHIHYSPIADKNLAKQYHFYFPKVDQMHAVSNHISSKAIKYGADKKKIKVIYSCLNFDLIRKYKKNQLHTHKPYRFISVGRSHWVKGYHYSLSAVHRLIQKDFLIQYNIICNNDPSEELLFQISDLSLEENVIIQKLPSQEQVYKKMKESDCFILPSVNEGISNAVIESMSIGLPVVSSNCGGMEEVIRNGNNGFLYKNRDVNQLEKTLETVMNLKVEKRYEVIKSALIDISEKFNSDGIKHKFHDLYKNTLR